MTDDATQSPDQSGEGANKVQRTGDADMGESTELNMLNKQLTVLRAQIRDEEDDVNRRVLMMVTNGVDVTEVFSPPRIVEMAVSMGLVGGKSFNLKTGWDFSRREHRLLAMEYVIRNKPKLIIGSPPCTCFSITQNLNLH